jgi:hypothetical protein
VVEYQRVTDFVRSFGERLEKRDDIHVDHLASPPRGPDEWVATATATFTEAVIARERLGVPATVAVEIFLALRSEAAGMNFGSLADLTNQLSWTPPALALYRADATPDWTDEVFQDVTEAITDRPLVPGRVLLQEWRSDDEDGQIDRRVWLVAPLSKDSLRSDRGGEVAR